MQGRAGRRGMDVQGNIVYLGMDWPYIENLMLGQISQVTGKEPRYPLMALQQLLAASNDPNDTKHFAHDEEEKEKFAFAIRRMQKNFKCFPYVTEQQMQWMAGSTLGDFCESKTPDNYLGLSKKVLHNLGYIHEDGTLAMDHNAMTMVWELHEYGPVANHLCAVLDQLYLRFAFQKQKQFRESDATQNSFLAVLIHVVDRHPAKEGENNLQELLRITPSDDGKVDEDAQAMWSDTEKILQQQKELIDSMDIPDEEKAKMHLELPPGDDAVGPLLDTGVYEMLVSKQKGFAEGQDIERRNELKNRVVRLGHVCRIAHNNIQQPHGNYAELEVLFRKLFQNIKYSVADMMKQLTDQHDVTEV